MSHDASCSDPDVEKLIMDEAGHLGARAVSCTLAPTPEYSETPVEDGFAGHGRVRDLDEVFLRAFHEGAGIVPVRASTPLIRETILRRALLRLTRCSAVLGPSAGGYYLIGLRRMARAGQGTLTRYEPGLLAGAAFPVSCLSLWPVSAAGPRSCRFFLTPPTSPSPSFPSSFPP